MSKRKDRERAKHTLIRNGVAMSAAKLKRTVESERAAKIGLVLPAPTLMTLEELAKERRPNQ